MLKNILSGLIGLICLAVTVGSCTKEKAKYYGDAERGKYAVWARIGNYPNSSTFVVNVQSLDTGTLNYVQSGIEVDEKLNYGLVIKDGYYYETLGKGRFGKYQIKNDRLQIVQEVPFTHLGTEYAHTWMNGDLVLIGPSGDNKSVRYAVMDSVRLKMHLGEIALPAIPQGYDKFIVGFAQYRPSDGKLFLGFNYGLSSNYKAIDGKVNIAVIDPNTFKVEQIITDSRTNQSGFTSLFQPYSFMDNNQNIYFAAGQLYGDTGDNVMLLRISNGSTVVDPGYKIFDDNPDRISGIWNLDNGKAIVRYNNSKLSGSHIFSFGVLDLGSGQLQTLDIPPCSSGSIQSVIVESDKAYILTNHEGDTDGFIYSYTKSSGTVAKGMRVPPGYTWLLRIDKLY